MVSLLLADRESERESAEPLVRLAAPSDLPQSKTDRRVHPRLSPFALDWLRAARLKYGASVDVLDLSVGGALLESEAQLKPGSTSVLEIVGESGGTLIPFRVLRCHVASLKGLLRYRGALEFKQPFLLAAPGPSPATEGMDRLIRLIDLSRLDLAVPAHRRRLSQSCRRFGGNDVDPSRDL